MDDASNGSNGEQKYRNDVATMVKIDFASVDVHAMAAR